MYRPTDMADAFIQSKNRHYSPRSHIDHTVSMETLDIQKPWWNRYKIILN